MDWTKDLGDAFMTQQKDVMDTIQVMRKKAMDAACLKSDENQTVTTTEQGQTEIQPANPEPYMWRIICAIGVVRVRPGISNYQRTTGGYSGICTAPAWPWVRGMPWPGRSDTDADEWRATWYSGNNYY